MSCLASPLCSVLSNTLFCNFASFYLSNKMERTAFVEVVEGASLHLRAGARLVRSPSLLLHCLPCCLLTLSTALAAATT